MEIGDGKMKDHKTYSIWDNPPTGTKQNKETFIDSEGQAWDWDNILLRFIRREV